VTDDDGANVLQPTSFATVDGLPDEPTWSPDAASRHDIDATPSAGGAPQRLTDTSAPQRLPSRSR
jgi:hypothetical protein